MSWAGIAAVTGCAPADPGGQVGCVPSSGTPTVFADAPAWTFVSVGPAVLHVTDAFARFDQFEVFDFGGSLGLTSVPAESGVCGNDPVPCLSDPLASSGSFLLAAGAHSITINQIASTGNGAAYFMWDLAAIPEPGTLALFGLGLAGLGFTRRSKTA